MLNLVIFVLELIALYFFSRVLTKRLFGLFLLLFRSRTVAVTWILLLEFPGTVVHELAHLFTAEILGVRTGKLRLEPESIREDNIQSGSVMIEETDPFRRYLIGLAPIGWGIVILTALSYFLPGLWHSVTASAVPWYQNKDLYLLLLSGYFVFAVSNGMFSSPEDVKGIFPFLIVIAIFIAGGFLLGIRFQLTGTALTVVSTVLQTLVNSILGVLGLNIALLLITKLAQNLVERMLHVRLGHG